LIISASRRTDIPAFYADWFINRLHQGFVYVKNPRNPRRIAKVVLNPEVVDCIVFWTKNPRPMLDRLNIIDALGYRYYFQFTLTPYDRQVETGLPAKAEIMETFRHVSDKIGSHRVVWRYDPVIISSDFSVQYHLAEFDRLCGKLAAYTQKCVFSFIDLYAKIRERLKPFAVCEINTLQMNQLAQGFAQIAKRHKLTLATCSEAIDFASYGIAHAACIDQGLLEHILCCSLCAKKDPNQRPACQCIESIDIGAYNCCSHGCVYCYATTSENMVCQAMRGHDPHSPLLGQLRGDEIITDRRANSLKVPQISLF
jgi:hypothetical protein